MKYTYEEKPELNIVIRTSEDGEVACIPISEANSDYQVYLNPDKVEHLTEIPTPDEA